MVNLKEYIHADRMDYYPFVKGFLMDYLLKTEQFGFGKFVKI